MAKASSPSKTRKTSTKTTKKSFWRTNLTSPVRILLFLLTFAVIGTWYLVATHADTPYGVRFVFVCASNSCDGSKNNVQAQANAIQSWYQQQVGQTFRIESVRSYQSSQSVSQINGGRLSDVNTWHSLHSELSNAGIIGDPNIKVAVVLGFHGMDHCGLGSQGGDLAIIDPFQSASNCSGLVNGSGLAHEIGHNFDLPGTTTKGGCGAPCHTTDGTLMNTPTACNNRPLGSCSLWSQDVQFAKSSPWFKPPANKPIGNVDGINCNSVRGWTFDADDPNQSIHVQIFMDGAYGSGTTSYSFDAGTTNQARPDVNQVYGIGGTHGFDIAIPTMYRDGRAHSVTLYGINIGPNADHFTQPLTYGPCSPPTSPNPFGYADSCSLEDNGTVTAIYGWATDDQAGVGNDPSVLVRVGDQSQTVPTNLSYREAQIDGWLPSQGHTVSNNYGFKARFTGLTKGNSYAISGTMNNVGIGASTQLLINNGGGVDGGSLPYFAGNKIPDACLPAGKTVIVKPDTTDPNANFAFTMATAGYTDAAYKNKTTVNGANTHNLNYDWGAGSPAKGVQPDWFYVAWQGTFTSPGSGTYTFYSEEDDGFALVFNNSQTLSIDAWNKPTPTGQTSLALTAGQKMPITAYMYEYTGNAKAKLYWSGPGITGRPLFPNLK